MKYLLLILLLLSIPSILIAQSNTYPTTGKVGIGTTTPSEQLDVNGNLIVDSCVIIKDSLIVQEDARISGDSYMESDLKIGGDLYLPGVPDNNNFDELKIVTYQNDGSVAKSSLGELFSWEPPKDTDPSFCEAGSAYSLNPYWSSEPNQLVTLCPLTYVGIATTTPQVHLDVNGKSHLRRVYMGVADPLNTDPGLYFNLEVPYTDTTLDRKLFIIQNQGRQLFTINNNGLLQSREIKIDVLNWGDYVFNQNYPLMPLEEVEAYIKENGHLPNVPSEQEVKAEGINVAEMDAILLKKIEELTLYILELEKRVDELED